MRHGRAARSRGLLGCGLSLAIAGCGGAAQPDERLNLVVVLVDALRADHLGAYGYARDTSPRIDAFAAKSVLFESARSQAPCTFPSINSLLTSRDPILFHGRKEGALGVPDDLAVLPEILQEHGYATGAVSESPIFRKTPTSYNEAGAFGRGFDSFDETCFREDFVFDAQCVNDAARRFLDAAREPFYLHLHYMQPHDRYHPPPAHVRRFAGRYAGNRAFIAEGNPNPIAKMIYRPYGRSDWVPEEDLQHLIDLYDDEIAWFDDRFGALLDDLERRGVLERTLVVLVSDHGEDFLEQGDIKHCRSLRDTQIRTPLVMWIPGAGARRLAVDAQNLDVVPTVLDYLGDALGDPLGDALGDGLGVDVAKYGFDGRSLRGAIDGGAAPVPGAFSAWRSSRAVVDGGSKLLLDLASGDVQLFRVNEDPGELNDVSGRRPEEVARLEKLLRDRVRRLEGDRARRFDLQEGVARQLEELGYLE